MLELFLSPRTVYDNDPGTQALDEKQSSGGKKKMCPLSMQDAMSQSMIRSESETRKRQTETNRDKPRQTETHRDKPRQRENRQDEKGKICISIHLDMAQKKKIFFSLSFVNPNMYLDCVCGMGERYLWISTYIYSDTHSHHTFNSKHRHLDISTSRHLDISTSHTYIDIYIDIDTYRAR